MLKCIRHNSFQNWCNYNAVAEDYAFEVKRDNVTALPKRCFVSAKSLLRTLLIFYDHIKSASHWPIIKESGSPQSVVRLDEICSNYFPPIFSIPLPDRRTKSHIGNQKLPPIVGPKSDMADYRQLPPIIIFPDASSPTARFYIWFFIRPDQSGNGTLA